MTTQQEQLRYLMTLLESVESGEEKPVLPAVEKYNELMAALEEDLDESKFKKALAAGAVGIAALMSNFAHAAGPMDPANLIDASSPGRLAASCAAVTQSAYSAPGLDANALRLTGLAQTEFTNMMRAEMRSAGGQESLAITQAYTNALSKASNLSAQGQFGKILQPSMACIKAIN